ncbi:hypothetical protein [Halobaculum limi]|uniref:hypothetical protein n=1 Tax=Halobaculum limi TaxID=3031916 RepID=UPI00240758FA|nr:hypothetical protein [Halobaculum sp. YSMS11]
MDDAADTDAALVGTTLAEAATLVADRREGVDEETARATLSSVAEDDELTVDSIHDALAYAAKVVSTPATRAEFAGLDIGDAREAASDVADVDTVDARLAAFEERLGEIESRVAALDEDLQTLAARAGERSEGAVPDDVFAFARDLGQLEARANEQQGAADELAMEVEEFERWLSSPSARHEELAADVSDLSSAVDRLGDDVDAVVDGDGDANLWFDCLLRRRVLSLQVRDLEAEVSDLRTLVQRADDVPSDHTGRLDGAVDDLADLDSELADAEQRLDAVATPEWRDRFDDRLDAFDDDLDSVSPPVPWGRVLRALEAARSE